MFSKKPHNYGIHDIRVGVIGATGNVGRTILQILEEKGFSQANITAVASRRSIGREISYGDKGILKVIPLEDFDFSSTQVVLSSAGSTTAKAFVERAMAAGSIVIDNSSAFRLDKNVSLLIPEVNAKDIALVKQKRIIASPNCAMIQLAVALKPLDDFVPIKRVIVSTYQSVSGAGKKAMDELFSQTRAVYMNSPTQTEYFPKVIAFNLIPQIDSIDTAGHTGEEIKIMKEFKKVMHRDIPISVTAVRVPVFIGHSMSVNVEFKDKMTVSDARSVLKKAHGVTLIPDSQNYTTPAEVCGENDIFISRIRKDLSCEHGLNMWIVADNLRKGAALNVVQILELLIERKIV